jgi:hypothetical protein
MGSLVWAMLFGAIGAGYCLYGRQQRAPIPLACGVGMMVFPYFVSGTFLTLLVGAVLVAIPWIWR